MIVSYNWLKELVDFDFSADELAHHLTMVGLEVETMEKIGAGLESVIVARLDAVEKHPDADKLTVCQVNTGTETVQVVCGATNHKAGDLIALAQPGTVLPGDFKIKKSKIRGAVSCGMLCSESELGLAEESAGILILPPDLSLGQPAFEALGLTDVQMEIGLTPNRPDCLSHIGVAREIAAMTGSSVRLPQVELHESGEPIDEQTSITIEADDVCPRYTARLIKGVKVGPSPAWMVQRLEAVGQRSVNNVVDVTNYVLMELGHPLHAFDFNRLRDRRIVVRHASENEVFTSLDEQERQMHPSDLMIADGQGSVAIAGIMGGLNSEVEADTVDILLESAWFAPTAIRRTSKRLGMHTEASHRFERGADIDMAPIALDRATQLIVDVAGGQVAPGMIDAYPGVVTPVQLTLNPAQANALLGLQLEPSTMRDLLQSIELDVTLVEDGSEPLLDVRVPTFRPDLEREVDLIEEIARLYGYDQIPVTMPTGRLLPQRASLRQRQVQAVCDQMVAAGFAEAINYSFVSPNSWDRLNLSAEDLRRTTVAVMNPLTEEQSVMRTTLVSSMLDTVARNQAHRNQDIRLFEMRPVFRSVEGQELPQEPLMLCAAISGHRAPEGWSTTTEGVDFFDLKGVVEQLLQLFCVPKIKWETEDLEPYLHPGKAAVIKSGRQTIGSIGEVHPLTQETFELERAVYVVELNLETIFSVAQPFAGFEPLSRFPGVYRDSALLLDEDVTAQELSTLLHSMKIKDLEQISLFDLYQGKGIPEGKKSMAIRVRYRSMEKTLTDEDVSTAHDKIIRTLSQRLGAEIR